jgi:hypothetical protein
MTKFRRFRRFFRAYIRRRELRCAVVWRADGYSKGISYANGYRAGELGMPLAPMASFYGYSTWLVEYRAGHAAALARRAA